MDQIQQPQVLYKAIWFSVVIFHGIITKKIDIHVLLFLMSFTLPSNNESDLDCFIPPLRIFSRVSGNCLVMNTCRIQCCYTPAQRSWRGGILDSPCPSVRPSVCRRHGFRSISQVCFGISISNFICMLMVAIGRSLLIFSVVTFKMAAWWPYWIFWFPDSNFSLALNINFKLQRHNTYVYG